MQQTTKQSVVASLAHLLETEVAGIRGDHLPPMGALAVRYRVSRTTVAKAVRRLVEKGILEVRARGKIRLARAGSTPLRPREDSCLRLVKSLEEDLASGRIRSGDALPKIATLSREHRVTDRTVRRAYQQLIDTGLAHRSGRQTVAGREAGTDETRVAYSPAAILILAGNRHTWASLCTNRRTGQFGEEFVREAQRHRVRLVQAYSREVPPSEQRYDPCAAGRNAVSSLIRELGPRYLGTVVAGRREQIPDLQSWVSLLGVQGRPVVWLDDLDTGPVQGVASPWFRRCHSNEDGAVSTALTFLSQWRHRSVAWVTHGEPEGWRLERERRITRMDESVGTAAVHLGRFAVKNMWSAPGRSHLVSLLERLRVRGRAPRVPPLIDHFVAEKERFASRYGSPEILRQWKESPFLGIASFLSNREVTNNVDLDDTLREYRGILWAALALAPCLLDGATAIIAPNDVDARSFHLNWLRDLAARVPEEISVISFDNAFRHAYVPLTTVDMGFGDLGYRAFHAILQDVPVRHDRLGGIRAVCSVVDRGSTGAPFTGRIGGLETWGRTQ